MTLGVGWRRGVYTERSERARNDADTCHCEDPEPFGFAQDRLRDGVEAIQPLWENEPQIASRSLH